MEEYVLKLENYEIYHKGYSKECLLRIPSFTMKRGDIVFLRGGNGTGKSTLLKALFSFDPEVKNYIRISDRGSAKLRSHSFEGFELDLLSREHSISKMHQSISYLGQNDFFGSRDDVVRAIASHAQAALIETEKGLGDKQTKIVEEAEGLALKYLSDIYKYEEKYYKASEENKKGIALKILKKKLAQKCSFGQQKMISILAEFLKTKIMKSDLFVMDEPLNHLDAKNKSEVVKLLDEYVEERAGEGCPVTMIIISHCLIFPFINKGNCHQWVIKDNQLQQVKDQDKVYINCLENGI